MIALFIVGVIGGIIGGMGMGGGTLLIPLLTAFCGVQQHLAQAINLVAFVPMSIVSIIIHAKNGFIKPKYILSISLPAALAGVLFSMLALNIEGRLLSKAFGVFLIILGIIMLLKTMEISKVKHPVL